MCRNIRTLHNFSPPTTPEEIHAAALQFVRKVSGLNKPSAIDEAAFAKAIEAVAATTGELLSSLQARGAVRTRESEIAKARARWQKRIGGAPLVPRGR